MNELEIFILVVFAINCVLNILVLSYFRTIIKEEKHLDEMFTEISEYWHKYLRIEEKEKGKDGVE